MKRNNFLVASLLFFVTVIGIYACSKSSTGTTPPITQPSGSTSAISMKNMAFVPANVTVAKGTVITWTNTDGYPHTVTSNDNGATFSSGNVNGGGTFTYTASVAGSIPYHCLIHGLMMSGVITVNP